MSHSSSVKSWVLSHGLLFDVWKYFKENPVCSCSGLLVLLMPVPDPAFPHPAKLSQSNPDKHCGQERATEEHGFST